MAAMHYAAQVWGTTKQYLYHPYAENTTRTPDISPAVTDVFRREQTLAEDDVGVRQVGDSLEQDALRDLGVVAVRVELVQLEQRQVRLQVVRVVLALPLHVLLEHHHVVRVVPDREEMEQ